MVLGALSGGLAVLVLAGMIPLALLFSAPGGLLSAAVAPRIAGPRRLQLIAGAICFVATGLLTRIYSELVSGGPHHIDPNPIALMFAIYGALVGIFSAGWWRVSAAQRALRMSANVRSS